MAVKTTVVGAWVEGAVKNWFTEEEDGRRMMGRAWRPQLKGEVEGEEYDSATLFVAFYILQSTISQPVRHKIKTFSLVFLLS